MAARTLDAARHRDACSADGQAGFVALKTEMKNAKHAMKNAKWRSGEVRGWGFAALLIFTPACAASGPPTMTTPPPSQPPVSGPEADARAFVDELAGHRFGAAAARFDATMLAALPEEKLGAVWAEIERSVGAFASVEGARTSVDGAFRIVHVTARFGNGRRELRVVFDAGGRIAGFFQRPVMADLEASARKLVDALARGDSAAAASDFDATMSAALPAEKLGVVWGQILAQAGAFSGIDAVKVTQTGGHWTALATCRFAKAPLVAKVVFDGHGKVAGLFFVPPEAVAPWQPPPYAAQDRFTERQVTLGGVPALPGTLTLPKGAGPFPAVVLVHGSGPNDADESIGGAKVFKDFAWGLASKGVAVLRYVKRTRHSPAGVVGIKEEVLDGARAAVELCRATPEIDPKRVVVAGHSQGAELAPRIATETPGVAAIVMLAAPSRPLQDVVVDQFTYFATLHPGPEADGLVAAARAFKATLDDPALKPDAEVAFPGHGTLKGAYFLSMRGYKAVDVAGKLTIPILVLQGDRDYQVTAPDLAGYKAALGKKPNVTIKQYAACNHLFIAGSGTPRPEEYATPGHVDAQVIDDIAAFVAKLPR